MRNEKKTILEELVKADIRVLQGNGFNMPLSYGFQNLVSGDFSESVPTTTTPCFFGGERSWFLCPLCSKRVAILYLKDSFGCRDCHGLVYASQYVNRYSQNFPLYRILSLGQKIEDLEKNIKRRQYAGQPTKKQLLLTSLQGPYLKSGISFLEYEAV